MKINSIEINNVGGIKSLSLNLNQGFNFICGPNGIGKTTILECIAHSFTSVSSTILRRNAMSECGEIKASIDNNGQNINTNVEIRDFEPVKESHINGLDQHAIKLLSLKVTRTFQYENIDAVRQDNVKKDYNIYEEASTGVNISEVKNWFIHRYLYSKHDNAMTSFQLHNFELAKECFSLLNKNFNFSRVMASSNDIMINTPSGEIYYEYLSSGFKSCLSIIFGIIKDIEFRFINPGINADEFDGIVVIDELELHLHPEWQSKIAKVLQKVFPKVQFITSTHSPHIIQSAQSNEIIALSEESGDVYRRELNNGKYGFQGWSIEEVLSDVMGMTDTKTELYQKTLSSFEKAIDNEDYEKAKNIYSELNQLMHPDNHLRKLLKFELASIAEEGK